MRFEGTNWSIQDGVISCRTSAEDPDAEVELLSQLTHACSYARRHGLRIVARPRMVVGSTECMGLEIVEGIVRFLHNNQEAVELYACGQNRFVREIEDACRLLEVGRGPDVGSRSYGDSLDVGQRWSMNGEQRATLSMMLADTVEVHRKQRRS